MFSASIEVVLTIAYREAVSRRHAYRHARTPALRARARHRGRAHPRRLRRPTSPRLRRELDAYLEPVDRAAEARRSDASRSRRPRSAASCRPRCCTCRARSAPKSKPATSAPRSSSSRRRMPRSCWPSRASPGSTCSSTSRTASRRRRSAGVRDGPRARRRRGRRRRRRRHRARSAGGLLRQPHRTRASGPLDPLIGRADELQRTIEVLCRRRKNNPVFVGDAGVGKTAMAEGLAVRLLDDDVQDALKGAEIFALDTGGAARRHALPRRLRGALQGGDQGAQRAGRRRSSSSTRSTRPSAPARRPAARWTWRR